MTLQMLDETRVGSFSDILMTVLNHGAVALMVSIGHRTRLFDTMADLWWATSGEVARASGLNERYVREWLGAMTAAGIVEHRTRDGAYRMHCMSVSLAAGGPGLGAMWGKEAVLKMLQEAGFRSVRVDRLQHDFQNFYYTADKHR